MTTVINSPTPVTTDDGAGIGLGMVFGVIITIALIILFVVFGIPALSKGQQQPAQPGTNINVTLPTGSTQGTN